MQPFALSIALGHAAVVTPGAAVVLPSPSFLSSSRPHAAVNASRSEEHTSELQSQSNLVCRLLLEKKNKFSCEYPHEPAAPAYWALRWQAEPPRLRLRRTLPRTIPYSLPMPTAASPHLPSLYAFAA